METVEKKKKPVEKPAVRTLKIEPFQRKAGMDAKKVPSIRLCGEWLQKCGFPPEGRVTVSTAHKQLIIRLDN
jgi:hypothetical protein